MKKYFFNLLIRIHVNANLNAINAYLFQNGKIYISSLKSIQISKKKYKKYEKTYKKLTKYINLMELSYLRKKIDKTTYFFHLQTLIEMDIIDPAFIDKSYQHHLIKNIHFF
jgi:hypothetical protein